MKKKNIARVWASVLSCCMLLSLAAPSTVAAADGDTTPPSDGTTVEGMTVNKTARLEADGTYTIDLEAYANGEVKTITTTKNVPCDIVMVLDQSGSMNLSMEHDPLPEKSYTYSNWGINTKDGDFIETEYYYKDGDQYRRVLLWDYPGNDNYYVDFYGADGKIYYFTKNGGLTTEMSAGALTANDVFYSGVLYKKSGSRLDVLKKSAKKFVEQVQSNAAENNVDHRIALTAFSQKGEYGWNGTGIYDGANFVRYAQDGNATSSDIKKEQYQAALVDVRENKANLDKAIDTLSAIGFTYANYGMELANNVLDAREVTTFEGPDGTQVERSKIVVFFTDGIPGNEKVGGRFSECNDSITTANATITEADKLKAEGAKVFSIATVNGAKPENSYNFTEGVFNKDNIDYVSYESATEAINAYLHFVSSDWEKATNMTTPPRNTMVNNGYYFVANNASELDKIFETITGSLDETVTTVELDDKAVIRDVIADEFKLPVGFNPNDNITVKTAAYRGNKTWDTPVNFSGNVTIKDNNTIDVSGFSYKDNYVAEEIPGKRLWNKSTPATGKKLMVTITGVLAKDETNGNNIGTNKGTSGVYSNGDGSGILAAPFPQPTVNLPEKSYVLDYGKKVNVETNEILGTKAEALAIDTGYNQQDTTAYNTEAKHENGYGTAALATANVTYTPQTMNWDGYDEFKVLAELATKDKADYEWSAVNFIPANSVYYEDDFITNTTSGTVGIEYKGNWENVGTKNLEDSQSSENKIYGQDPSYDNEKEYSDGAAQAGSHGATATFNFTGEGVDIYSSTDSDACVVNAYLYDATGKMIKRVSCNNFGADGKYYTVPTVAFEKLPYGKYTVKLQVLRNQTVDTAVTYYLDGIRVYNPLGTVIDDGSDAGNAYKEAGELNAVFTEIRSMLLDPNGSAIVDGDGALYFDQIADENGVITNEPGKYESVGPEHEAYLSSGNGVAFTMQNFTDEKVYVGIKLVKTGSGDATVEVTNGAEKEELTINSTADTYFPITPDSNGNVAIKNVSLVDVADNANVPVISVTKVRTTSPTKNDISFKSNQETVSYISAFNDLPLTDNDEDIQEPEGGDVDIDNGEDNNKPGDAWNNFIKDVFNQIKKWLGKRGNK